ncbi:ferredoxin reductase domain-containing protein [Kribbella endophytica]
MQSHRLMVMVLGINLVILGLGLGNSWWGGGLQGVVNLALVAQGNFAVGVLVRQQFLVNGLSRLVMRVPKSWPLRVRWALAKGYHLGGLHVGGAVCGTFWFLGLVVVAVGHVGMALTAVYFVQAALLVGIVMTSRPKVRAKRHDLFERVHRFGGWGLSALFWIGAVLLADERRDEEALWSALASTPTVWVLVVTTVSSLVPWMLLRRIPIEVVRPSSHVALVKSGRSTPMAGTTRAISRHPLRQWHSFAVVPTPGQDGFRMAVSRAGDWTGEFIDEPPSHVWVRGVATAGMANYGTVFKRVVYVVTGSGIGPVLAHVLAARVPHTLVWVTRDPVKTYGQELVDEILAAQPDTVIWDTDARGKPDMVKLAYAAYAESEAEAVICVSNKKVTWSVVHGMERLGIPALGPIWDS